MAVDELFVGFTVVIVLSMLKCWDTFINLHVELSMNII